MLRCEIEDLETGCTYIKEGETLNDCKEEFADMFLGLRKFKVLWSQEITESMLVDIAPKKTNEELTSELAKEFLDELCTIDFAIKNVLLDGIAKEQIVTRVRECFKELVEYQPELGKEVSRRVLSYYKKDNLGKQVFDFIYLLDWYVDSFKANNVEYFSKDGEYFNLRMNEVITTLLIARHNFKLI